MLSIISDALLLFALVFWVGGISLLALIVAPAIFSSLTSRTQSGNIVSMIFHRLEILAFLIMALLVFSEVLKFLSPGKITGHEIFISGLLFSLVVFLLLSFTYINHQIQSVRAQIVSFDDSDKNDSLRKVFGYWHGILMSCLMISVLLGASVLYLRFVL